MSCSGCRVLRKGCNENCILRQSLIGIENPQAQANATLFVAKFFGRAGLISFLSAVPDSQRPALFQSLLFEACGRTVNPVNGAVGLLWTGKWHLCQSAVETVLLGGVLHPIQEFSGGSRADDVDDASDASNVDLFRSLNIQSVCNAKETSDLDLNLNQIFPAKMTAGGRASRRRAETPSEESDTTSLGSGLGYQRSEGKLLRLFF
ncbi:hypothetical protein RHSIM_Rhsim05G0090300 [Rhododendron simsii]|uniref:LOB domain-containing protein n=1 Tax=Rhododendron simsii TaxID=118357 RepID=A0A834GZ36_RHOSS|nr:hypothetical protein RHSIM_Rhsim05G0090300 [Rhododendron simsii]